MTDKVLIIIRGLPGSGKSSIGKAIMWASNIPAECLVETDQFFTDRDGTYRFDKSKLHEAHKWCYDYVKKLLHLGGSVIVSNTATQQWEYKKYIDLAREHGYKVQVIDVHGEFENVHGVPEEHLTKMAERWEPFEPNQLRNCRYGE